MNVTKPFSVPAVPPAGRNGSLKTYAMDEEKKRIGGLFGGERALRQWIRKALRTRRFAFGIYDADYGSEVETVLRAEHTSPALKAAELEAAVRDALVCDARIDAVEDFAFAAKGDALLLSFTVTGAAGVLEVEEEV